MFPWTAKKEPSPIERLRVELNTADTVIIGAGAGLSTSAGFIYTGERFQKYFSDFADKYGFEDMYYGGFHPFKTPEEHWAYWSRYIYVNRYMNPPKPVYDQLYGLVRDKDYFVLTTNVDHCFQKAGFDKKRLFYTQGDYGLFQCVEPCTKETYENQDIIRQMVLSQGFTISGDGTLLLPENGELKMEIPSDLIPYCPHCGKPMTMNLRSDDNFVEDKGWNLHADYYNDFMARHQNTKTLFLELAVGYNTPIIIKYNFWQKTAKWRNATYACLNYGQAYAPDEIKSKSICIDGDIGEILSQL